MEIMSAVLRLCVSNVIVLFVVGSVFAQNRAAYNDLTAIMDSARVMEVDIFAPEMFKKAAQYYGEASTYVRQNKNQKTIDDKVAQAREYVENGLKATEVARLSLQEYLEPRNKARAAKASVLVPLLYAKAEEQFVKATAKVESGDVKGGLKEAEKSGPLFDIAELEAIRVDVIGDADKLIEKAVVDEAEKYALSTLDKARTAQAKANAIITANRYNRAEAEVEAARAEYEARHAGNIAQSVRSLNRNDQAWEKLMLVYEIQIGRVGQAIGTEQLPFDEGPLAAADTLIQYITSLRQANERLTAGADKLYGEVSSQLKTTLARLAIKPPVDDPVSLAQGLDAQVVDLMEDKATQSAQIDSLNVQIADLKLQYEQTTADLTQRVELEEKFKKAKALLNPSEGEVLFNSANDIVLRLSGLSFDVGKADIKDQHIPLLEKVKEALSMFPDAHLVVEGHTDTQGDQTANLSLSEKRAYAVMQYLRQMLLIPAERIESVGFGAEKPVASNETPEGRAKNRRIDIVIMH
jgi:OmpA-OmpF porin, OOP family